MSTAAGPQISPPRSQSRDEASSAPSKAHKPDKKAKSPPKSSTPSVKRKNKPDEIRRKSDSTEGSSKPKRPRHSVQPSAPVATPTSVPKPSSSIPLRSEDRRSRSPHRHSSEKRHSAVVTVPSRSPSVCSRPPSELFDPEDVSPRFGREMHRWFTDIEPDKSSRPSRGRSRGARDGTKALHLYRHYAKSPSPETYARLYYASREFSDSRYPPLNLDRAEARQDCAALSPPSLPKQPPIHSHSSPSAALGAPPEEAPLESPDPPLYAPDLTREESSSDSTDHDSKDSDSNRDDSMPTAPDSDLGNAGSLSPSDGPKAFLQLMDRMCKALKIQLTCPASKETDYVHKLVQADMPAGVLLPMLPVHLPILQGLNLAIGPHEGRAEIEEISETLILGAYSSVAAAQALAEERRNQSSVSPVPVPSSTTIKTATKPVIDGSILRSEERQRLARERREEREKQH
ncbi:UNVERIFIED_CONTAM: hypothetical protein K2H54_034308, partial [Gekko kuhli]